MGIFYRAVKVHKVSIATDKVDGDIFQVSRSHSEILQPRQTRSGRVREVQLHRGRVIIISTTDKYCSTQ